MISRILDLFLPTWKEQIVTTVTFLAPPHISPLDTLGVATPLDAWKSDTLERGASLFEEKGYHCVDSTLSEYGPTFAVERRLEDLLSKSGKRAYCAKLSFATLLETSRVTYPTDVILEGIQPIQHSCHLGSHTIVPNAPYLTLLLLLEQAVRSAKGTTDFVYADDVVGVSSFLDVSFRSNAVVDEWFQYVSLFDVPVSRRTQIEYKHLSERIRSTWLPKLLRNTSIYQRETSLPSFMKFVESANRQKGGSHGNYQR